MGVNGEVLQLDAIYKKPHFVLQVTRESVSGTTSHVRVSECAMKLLASYPGRVGGERRPGIDCLRMRGRFRYISVKL